MRVAIITRQEGPGSSNRLVKAFEGRGHSVDLINTLHVRLQVETGRLSMGHAGEPMPHYDVVLARIGHLSTDLGMLVLQQMELQGMRVLPSSRALLASRHKLRALQKLAAAGIPVPATSYVAHRSGLRAAIEALGGAPLIVKVVTGTQGRGVVLAESNHAAEAIADALIAAGSPVILQRFVAESRGRDVRAFVVGGRVLAGVRRVAAGAEYRSNVHLGASAEVVALTPRYAEVAVAAAGALDLEIAGVDLLEGADGPVVVEVNSSPGIAGFEEASGLDVAGIIVSYLEGTPAEELPTVPGSMDAAT